MKFSLTRDLNGSARQLFAVEVARTTQHGLVHLTDQSGFVYATRSALSLPSGTQPFARAPTRSLLAATSPTLGVAALTVLVAITTVFHNALAGSLLGSAITLQVKGSEYAAVAVIIVLAIASIADIPYLGVRERAAELATLRATGWTNPALARIVVLEALWPGLVGSLTGAGVGLLVAATFAAAPPGQLILVAIIAAIAGTLVTALAALARTAAISRLAIVSFLAAE